MPNRGDMELRLQLQLTLLQHELLGGKFGCDAFRRVSGRKFRLITFKEIIEHGAGHEACQPLGEHEPHVTCPGFAGVPRRSRA